MIYRVTSPRRYREHRPGATFEATLPPDVEERAVRQGAIEVIDATPTSLQPGSWTVADGWRNDQPDSGGKMK